MSVIRKVQVRRGTAAAWNSANPTLSSGEFGYDTTNGKVKIGDGVTAWNSLAFATYTPAEVDALIADFQTSADVQAAIATFENISRNAYSWPATKTYSNGRLATTVYTTNDGTITKTLNYDTSGAITSIVLSGDVPVGVSTTKTLTYLNGLVTGQAYT